MTVYFRSTKTTIQKGILRIQDTLEIIHQLRIGALTGRDTVEK